jgi:L-ascorbate oxidase
MTVVEVAGQYVEPVTLANLDVYSGETYSVIFTADQNTSRNYWATVNVRGRNQSTPQGLAVLNYLPNSDTLLPTTPPTLSPQWNLFNLSMANAQAYRAHPNYAEQPPTGTANRQLFLFTTQNTFNGGKKWAVNNISYVPTTSPVLGALKYDDLQELGPPPPDSFDLTRINIYDTPNNTETTTGSGLYIFQLNDIVDVIIQNTNMLKDHTSEIHPWHLHGHDFWVLGYGTGVYDPQNSTQTATLNYQNPLKVNTAPVFPWGWTALRFVANNPGAWPFHCHVEPHFHMGMGVIFAEGVDSLPAIPAENLGCGLSKKLIHL